MFCYIELHAVGFDVEKHPETRHIYVTMTEFENSHTPSNERALKG